MSKRFGMGRTHPMRYLVPAIYLCTGACQPDNITVDIPQLDQVAWVLELDHKGVVLADESPHNTLKLKPRLYNIRGEELPLSEPVHFTSNGPQVTVSEDGLITAQERVGQLRIVATVTMHNLTLRDTALVTVVAASTVSSLRIFSIQREAGDSAKLAVSSFGTSRTKSFAATVIDGSNNPMSPVSVFYKVSDPLRASINRSSGSLTALARGDVMVYASTNVFGVAMRDSLKVTIGPPLLYNVTIVGRTINGDTVTSFRPDSIELAVGGTVRWTNGARRLAEVLFQDITGISDGNIPAFGPVPPDTLPMKSRTFTTPGVFKYGSPLSGGSGVVVVR